MIAVASTTLAAFEFIDEEEGEVEGEEVDEDEFEERDVWICEKKILEDLVMKNPVLFVLDKRNSDIIVKKKEAVKLVIWRNEIKKYVYMYYFY